MKSKPTDHARERAKARRAHRDNLPSGVIPVADIVSITLTKGVVTAIKTKGGNPR